MNKQLTKEAKQFSAFITDIVGVMEKHKVENLLVIFGMNKQIRNTCLSTKKEGVEQFYANLSDGINAFLKQGVNN